MNRPSPAYWLWFFTAIGFLLIGLGFLIWDTPARAIGFLAFSMATSAHARVQMLWDGRR